jgi:OOP family OmpA-OmpF porin
MMKFRSLVLSGVLIAAASGPALAQDTAGPWNGLYAGINAGGGWGESKQSDVNGNTTGRYDLSGPVAGAQLGYNFSRGPWVFGPEADFDWADISGKRIIGAGTFSTHLQWLGTVRGRVGYALGPILPYLHGGFAYGNVKAAASDPTSVPAFSTSGAKIHPGWTVGAGAEYLITPMIGAKLEYNYVDLGSSQSLNTPAVINKIDLTSHIVRVGLNWHFGAPAPAPAPMPAVAPTPAPGPAQPAVAPTTKKVFLVFFDFDKATLTPDGMRVVDEAAAATKNGTSRIELTGYTDLSGSPKYNLALSKKRAEAVQAYLQKKGLPANQIGVSWRGKENPRVPTADGVRELQNRRVEIIVP